MVTSLALRASVTVSRDQHKPGMPPCKGTRRPFPRDSAHGSKRFEKREVDKVRRYFCSRLLTPTKTRSVSIRGRLAFPRTCPFEPYTRFQDWSGHGQDSVPQKLAIAFLRARTPGQKSGTTMRAWLPVPHSKSASTAGGIRKRGACVANTQASC